MGLSLNMCFLFYFSFCRRRVCSPCQKHIETADHVENSNEYSIWSTFAVVFAVVTSNKHLHKIDPPSDKLLGKIGGQ